MAAASGVAEGRVSLIQGLIFKAIAGVAVLLTGSAQSPQSSPNLVSAIWS